GRKVGARVQGLLSDIVVDSVPFEGFADPEGKMARIHSDPFLNDRIEAMTSTLEIFAMLQFKLPNGEMVLRPIHLIGIDPEERAKIGGFAEYLQDPENRLHPSFQMRGEALRRYLFNNPTTIPAVHLINNVEPGQPPPPDAPPEEEKVPEGVIIGHAIGSFRKHGIS